MKIEVTPGIYWDSEAESQSEEAIEWLQETVRPGLSDATLDNHQRPDERTWENDTIKVVEQQLYITDSPSWARRGVAYTVTLK